MPHFITVPVNENGIVFDSAIDVTIQTALQPPFSFRDVFVYSHGWSTNADSAVDEYSRFSVSFAKMLLQTADGVFARPPRDTFGVGIHWPSEITEDPSSLLNDLQLFTFYTMEHRADGVGKNAVYTILRLMLEAQPGVQLRFFLIGHSFGCRVMCAALQDLQADLVSISKSALDEALGKWFPLAGGIANLLHKGDPAVALGFGGPTAATTAAFGSYRELAVDQNFTPTTPGPIDQRLLTADLTPLHQWRTKQGLWNGGVTGSHSDIDNDQVRALLAAAFFGPP